MTLFVGGIHGVGKTFLLKRACESLSLRHATASQLIKEQLGISNWTISRKVRSVEKNQQALIEAVKRITLEGKEIILDGHFVLRKSAGIHEKISVDTFKQLAIRGAVLLQAPVEVISERLIKRGDSTWSLKEIEIFAQKELEHAEKICQQLQIQLVKLWQPSELDIINSITFLLESTNMSSESAQPIITTQTRIVTN